MKQITYNRAMTSESIYLTIREVSKNIVDQNTAIIKNSERVKVLSKYMKPKWTISP